ncbi:MAG: DUF4147 domain-containing protein [Pirellulales bacterium]|nr:DUF4147 domain-containing protein [Pirellulales bacterium]
MLRSAQQLRQDALGIWRAGVDAVAPDRLVRAAVAVEGGNLAIGEQRLSLDSIGRIAVVGAGKAGTAMAAAFEDVLGPRLLTEKHVTGWVNVPADCVRPMSHVWLHPARPPGVNEPTRAGVVGTREIIELVESLGQDDLCLVLLSGGASALMPAPADPVTLADKLAVTRFLGAAGADIRQLNTVRKQLSRIKGGGLARACRAGRLVALIISDVPGDPLDVIASGPTVADASRPEDALEVLDRFGAREAGVAPTAFAYLETKRRIPPAAPRARVTNLVIGNNATAVDAAGGEAERRGYRHAMQCAVAPEGPAEEVGRRLAGMALSMRDGVGPDCLISGGEPVVALADESIRGRGGRNQQLVLAALDALGQEGVDGVAILSGGTDGEDGPTDAAGAVLDAAAARAARLLNLHPAEYLARNDAYTFFDAVGSLLKTGPTHTNVGDLRIVAVRPRTPDKGEDN